MPLPVRQKAGDAKRDTTRVESVPLRAMRHVRRPNLSRRRWLRCPPSCHAMLLYDARWLRVEIVRIVATLMRWSALAYMSANAPDKLSPLRERS